jgi:lipoprotein NlpI
MPLRYALMRILALAPLLLFGLMPALADDTQPSPAIERQLEQLSAAIAKNPHDGLALSARGELLAALGRPAEAIADYDQLIEIEPDRAAHYDARGSEHFKLGHIDASIKDFDRAIALQPDREPWHWKRGISYYYAGRWDDGRRQFEGYQTVDDNDVENAVWRFLCMVHSDGLDAARRSMLKIKHDTRVPMMEIYRLYLGQLQPNDVLAATEAGNPSAAELNARRFYAQLYLALYYEALGEAEPAKAHIEQARRHRIGHYMWNVADVHARRLNAKPPAAE